MQTGHFVNNSDDRIITEITEISFSWTEKKGEFINVWEKKARFDKTGFSGPLNPGRKSDTMSFRVCGYEIAPTYHITKLKSRNIRYKFKSIPYDQIRRPGGGDGKVIIIK